MTDTKRDDFMNTVHMLFSKLDKALAENAALTAQLDKNAAERYRLHLDKDELGEVHDEKLQAAMRYLLDENAALDAQLDELDELGEVHDEKLQFERAVAAELSAKVTELEKTLTAERAERMAAQDVCARLMRGVNENENGALRQAQSALESMQSRFKGLEADMRGTMTTLEAERNTVAHLRAQVQTKDDAITLLEEDNAALDARVGELLKAPIMPDHHPVGTEVYCRTPGGVRKSRIDSIRLTIGGERVITHYFVDGSLWAPKNIFLTADEAFASTTH